MHYRDAERRKLILALHRATDISIKHCYHLLALKREPKNENVAAIWRKVMKAA